MNSKQLSILLVLVVLIGGAGLLIHKRGTASWQSGGGSAQGKLLGDFPLNDVAQVAIKQASGELNLVKDGEIWKVKERSSYPANFQEISELLRKMWELKGVQQVKVGPSQLGRLDLIAPAKDKGTNTGTLVEFKDKSGKNIKALLLGKKHMRQASTPSPMGDEGGWPDGRFVMVVEDAPAPSAWVIADALNNVEAKAETWLSKDFVKVEKLKSVSVVTPVETNNWKLVRETEGAELKLVDKKETETLDNTKVSGVANVLGYASFTDVLDSGAKPEDVGMAKPVTATIETFDGFTYTIKIGQGTNDENHPFQVSVTADLPKERVPGKDEKKEDKDKLDKEFKDRMTKLSEKLAQEKALEKWTYVVSKWTIDPLLKARHELLASKKDEAKPGNGMPAPGAALAPDEPSDEMPEPTPPPVPGAP